MQNILHLLLSIEHSQTKQKNQKSRAAETAAASESTSVERSESIVVPEDDDNGPPLPDQAGLTVSTSWAILNTSTQSSPHLSPVSSEASVAEDGNDSMSVINGVNGDESELGAGDGTHTNTVLEVPADESDSTLLEEKSEQFHSVDNVSLLYSVHVENCMELGKLTSVFFMWLPALS